MKVYIPNLHGLHGPDLIFETTATRLTGHVDCIQANGIAANRKRVFHKNEWFESLEDAKLSLILDLQRAAANQRDMIQRSQQAIVRIKEQMALLGVTDENFVS